MESSSSSPRGRCRRSDDPSRTRLPSLREVLAPRYFDPPLPSSSSAPAIRLAVPTTIPTSDLSYLQINSSPPSYTADLPVLRPFGLTETPPSLQLSPPPNLAATFNRPFSDLSLRRYSLDSYAPHPPLPSTPPPMAQSQRSSRSPNISGSQLRRSSHPTYSASRHSSTPVTTVLPGSPETDRRYSCSFCSKSFSRKWDCDRHELIHTGHRCVNIALTLLTRC